MTRAQATYAGIALFQLGYVGLQTFRYRTKDWSTGAGSFYDDWTNAGTLGTTNFWKIANQIFAYGKLAVFGPAFLFQLLAMVGVLVDVNELVWGLLMPLALVIDIVYLGISALAYDKAARDCRNPGTAASCLVKNDMSREWLVFFATQAFAVNMLLPHGMAWSYGNYMWKQENQAAASAEPEEEPVEEAEAEAEAEVAELLIRF